MLQTNVMICKVIFTLQSFTFSLFWSAKWIKKNKNQEKKSSKNQEKQSKNFSSQLHLPKNSCNWAALDLNWTHWLSRNTIWHNSWRSTSDVANINTIKKLLSPPYFHSEEVQICWQQLRFVLVDTSQWEAAKMWGIKVPRNKLSWKESWKKKKNETSKQNVSWN